MLAIVNAIFPVGAIYTSTSSSFDPNTSFKGTTWTKLTNKFLVGAGSTYTLGATGGSTTRTLAVSNLPSHSHGLLCYTGNTRVGISNIYSPNSTSSNLGAYWCVVGNSSGAYVDLEDSTSAALSSSTNSSGYAYYAKNGSTSSYNKRIITYTGSGSSFSILPPYQAVYMWERTA